MFTLVVAAALISAVTAQIATTNTVRLGVGGGRSEGRRSDPQKEALRTSFAAIYKDPDSFDETYSILETIRSLALRIFVPGASRVNKDLMAQWEWVGLEQVLAKDEDVVSQSIGQPATPQLYSRILYQGDILLKPREARDILFSLLDALRRRKRRKRAALHWSRVYQKTLRRRKRKLTSEGDGKWLRGVVPYTFNDSLSDAARDAVLAGMKQWEDATCVHFHHLDQPIQDDVDHLDFFPGDA